MLEFTANGGDGYSMIGDVEVYKEGLLTDTDAVTNYIKDTLKGEIPEKYKDVQGRINKVTISQTTNNNNNNADVSETDDDKAYSYFKEVVVAIVLPLIAAILL